VVRHAIDLLASILKVDRRYNQGREVFDVPWPVTISIPLTPMEYDALRFLASLYPANPSEIARASLLPYLDSGSIAPDRQDDGKDMERTSRVAVGLDEKEEQRLEMAAQTSGVDCETFVRWALWDSLGPLMNVSRGH